MLKKLQVRKTAHYYVQNPTEKVTSILYVLHGYGQNADAFLKEFTILKDYGVLVIAPEALSKFYNKKGDAVSNWMTSRNRLDEIADYKQYLNQLREDVEQKELTKNIAFLGFSQGVSTCLRWLSLYQDSINCFLCSGSVPPELSQGDFKEVKHRIHYFFGDDDPLLTLNNAKNQVEQIASLGQELTPHPFKGSHEISESCLAELINWAQA